MAWRRSRRVAGVFGGGEDVGAGQRALCGVSSCIDFSRARLPDAGDAVGAGEQLDRVMRARGTARRLASSSIPCSDMHAGERAFGGDERLLAFSAWRATGRPDLDRGLEIALHHPPRAAMAGAALDHLISVSGSRRSISAAFWPDVLGAGVAGDVQR